jgi:NAD(P)-dependent dehydrogenase (short-subunit alcohol dehydrogenase family)
VHLQAKTVVVTGAARGIGRALATAFHHEGALVAVSDLDTPDLGALAATLDDARPGSAIAVPADVSSEAANAALISTVRETWGEIDLFFANAGVAIGTDLDTEEAIWQRAFDVNLHAHRWAAKYLLPDWLARGEGYFCSTASAAGLLAQIGSAPYTLTKHGALAFAEWLAITYGNRGLKVSCLCPQGVNTDMLRQGDDFGQGANVVKAAGAVLEPEEVAREVVRAIADERFLILPHPEVAEYAKAKANDREKWLAGMRRLQMKVYGY